MALPEETVEVVQSVRPRPRPERTRGRTFRIKTGCGNLYVTVNSDEHGLCEVFATMGKSGGCAASQSEAVARLVSLALRCGVAVEAIVKHLRGIRRPSPAWHAGGQVLSCADAIGIVLGRVAGVETGFLTVAEDAGAAGALISGGPFPVAVVPSDMNDNANHMGACPECGAGSLRHESGCITCTVCGWSKCS